MVLLLHELPDGTRHHDWLLQRDVTGSGLMSFGVMDRIDSERCITFHAERLPDHRLLYLTYEGPIHSPGHTLVPSTTYGQVTPEQSQSSDNPSDALGERGRVKRLAKGVCRILQEDPDRMVIQCRFESGVAVQWQGRRLAPLSSQPEKWIFHREISDISSGN